MLWDNVIFWLLHLGNIETFQHVPKNDIVNFCLFYVPGHGGGKYGELLRSSKPSPKSDVGLSPFGRFCFCLKAVSKLTQYLHHGGRGDVYSRNHPPKHESR